MKGTTHVLFGALTGAALTMAVGLSVPVGHATLYPIFTTIGSTTGSLIPDIDLPRSQMGRKYPWVSKFFSHRGMTHTLVFPTLIGIPAFMSTQLDQPELATMLFNVLFAFLWGWVMHIIADMCNKKGVPLFFPFMRKRIHVMTVLSSSWQENVWIVLCILGLGAFAYFKYFAIGG